ncbi:hypothetical protein KBX37_27270 [Micromonospora sp. U56]|uniref:hypothetical protein n=1 Tax=Micromonospora sp. U56 TaxID=2824900 RepID=UPI001B38DEE5|nr:hypothetical protein [Micromonospora sp. U56]MBQ0896749.1 hypothetical protein [Micromonospora sp. U56]
MLSFPAVHTLAGCLLAVDADADVLGWGRSATLLLIHDRPLHPDGPVRLRAVRSVEFPLHPDDLLTDPAGLPALLHRLATALGQPDRDAATAYQVTLDTIIELIGIRSGARLLAWAAVYDDLLPAAGRARRVRRVDAVDTDGRLYQLTHLHAEEHPAVAVHDGPGAANTFPAGPGLSALLAATARLAARSQR